MKEDKESPLVSTIITTHNRLELLKRAVKSVQAQTYPKIEIIIIDDASSDGTYEWGRTQKLNYIHIPTEKSRGGNYARNIGVQKARGEYLAFLDDDDFWFPEKIEKQLEKLVSSGNEVVHCSSKVEIIKKNGSTIYDYWIANKLYEGDLSHRILYQFSLLTSTMMVKRKALIEVGGFDENCKYWQDYELSIRLAQRKPFDLVTSPEICYRINQQDKNRLTNKYDGWLDAVEYIYNKHRYIYKNLNVFEKIRVKLLYWNDSSARAKSYGYTKIALFHKLLFNILSVPFKLYERILIRTK